MRDKIGNILVAISIALLLSAIAGVFSYENQAFRLVVCLTAIYLSLKSRRLIKKAWMWTMLAIAILFNPLILPVKFDKLDFVLGDTIVVCLLITSLIKVRDNKRVKAYNINLIKIVVVLLFFIITISIALYCYFLLQNNPLYPPS